MARDVVYYMGVSPINREKRDGGLDAPTELRFEEEDDFRIYERKGRITSVLTPDTIYKDASNFENLDRAERACKDWQAMGWGGAPSSPARVFSECLKACIEDGDVVHPAVARPDRSVVDPKEITWLWIESFVDSRTVIPEQVYHYDINEAFYSACAKGLPIRFEPYQDGDVDFVGTVEIRDADRELPNPWRRGEQATLTGEDVRYWGLDVDVIDAVTYADLSVDLSPAYRLVSNNFGSWTAKHARQQSWGCFARSSESVYQKVYRDGEVQSTSPLPSRWECPEWAVIITRRIMRQVDRAAEEGDGISCFVDSILSQRPISGIGDEKGQWREEGVYEDGVYVYSPGMWDDRPVSTPSPSAQWKRHAGIAPAVRTKKQTSSVDPRFGLPEPESWAGSVQVEKQWESEYEEYIREYTQDWMKEKMVGGGSGKNEHQESWRDTLKKEAPF